VALFLASPVLAVELIGGFLILLGAIVIVKGSIEGYRNP
jgi:hypothetical protein